MFLKIFIRFQETFIESTGMNRFSFVKHKKTDFMILKFVDYQIELGNM